MPAEWRADPSGVYDHRWWDGDRWTEHVSLAGTQLVDEVHDPSRLADATPPAETTAHAVTAEPTATESPVAEPTPPTQAPPSVAAPPVLPDAGWRLDPSGTHRFRWWDGTTWTEWVADDGEPAADQVVDPAGLRSPDPVGFGTGPGPESGTGSTAGRSVAAAGPERTVGDRVVNALGTVTLNNWANRRLADALMIPELTEAVREQPKDPVRRLHLGIRLAEMQLANERIKKAMPHVTGVSLVTRPVTRAVGRAVTNSLRSDTTPAHVKVLSPLHRHLVSRVRQQPRDPEALNALARLYWVARDPARALEIIKVSQHADPVRGETYYIGAELLIDLQQFDYVIPWARYARDLGCGLADAVLHPESSRRRQEYWSPILSTMTGYTSEKYIRAMARYYEPVPSEQLDAFLGPNPVTVRRQQLTWPRNG